MKRMVLKAKVRRPHALGVEQFEVSVGFWLKILRLCDQRPSKPTNVPFAGSNLGRNLGLKWRLRKFIFA